VRGPVVFVANHSSHLDTPLILGSLPDRFANRVAVGAASDYFFDVRWRAALTAVFFNAFPVERYGSRRLRSLALDLVDDGWSLLLYPEGTRSEDGWINPFKLGAAVLCINKNIPCVPIALRGSYAAMPRGRNWPQPGKPRVAVRYGRPIYPLEGEDVRTFRTRMAKAVSQLAAEEELGWYGAMRAAANDSLDVPGGSRAVKPGAVAVPPNEDGTQVASWRRVWASTKPLGDKRRKVWSTRECQRRLRRAVTRLRAASKVLWLRVPFWRAAARPLTMSVPLVLPPQARMRSMPALAASTERWDGVP
jgi:1-acyl-sn-glycerol-3-phosphate acyltransferase